MNFSERWRGYYPVVKWPLKAVHGKDIVSWVISALLLSRPASARANEGLALSPPTYALPQPPPSLSLWAEARSLSSRGRRRGGLGMLFKTQSPESALPKELLRPGLAGKDGGLGNDGGRGLYSGCWARLLRRTWANFSSPTCTRDSHLLLISKLVSSVPLLLDTVNQTLG